MKKLGLFLILAVLAFGTVFAQVWGGNGGAQQVTVNGTLQLQSGEIAVASGTSVYFVPTLARYIGFIEELKAGAAVSIEGYVYGNILEPARVTIAGKSYDFLASSNVPGYGYGTGGYGGYCGGYGCGGGYGVAAGRGMMGGMGRRW